MHFIKLIEGHVWLKKENMPIAKVNYEISEKLTNCESLITIYFLHNNNNNNNNIGLFSLRVH